MHEYHSSGNYTSYVAAYPTKEAAEAEKLDQETRYKGKGGGSAFEFDIEEVELIS